MGTDKKRADFQYTDVVYSIDKIRFISRAPVEQQRSRIAGAEPELLEHCTSTLETTGGAPTIVGVHFGKKGRDAGYISKIEASACDDEFIKIIKKFNMPPVSHLEIAQDLIFETMPEAEEYGLWFENNVERRIKRHKVSFMDRTTFYLGKESHYDEQKNYMRCYPRESKVTGMPCYHTEFVLKNAKAIKSALGIKSYKELTDSMNMYNMLENKYLKFRNEEEPRFYKQFAHPNKKKFGSVYMSRDDHKRLTGRLKKKQ